MQTTEEKVADILIKNKLTIATAESCTGGLLSSKLTDVSGSSAFVHLNFVTYSNNAKNKILGVKNITLEKYGAVSKECSEEMASGLYNVTGADICVSTTGIAGPTGGTKDKPVGLMYSTIFASGKTETYEIRMPDSTERIEMKNLFASSVMEKLYDFLLRQK